MTHFSHAKLTMNAFINGNVQWRQIHTASQVDSPERFLDYEN